VTQLLLSLSLLLLVCASLGQLGVAKGRKNEADVLHCLCRFPARLPLVRLISAVMPMILRPAGSRCGAAAGPD
jgi:hypothetical protein